MFKTIKKATSIYITYLILKTLLSNWENTTAFKNGIVDKTGKELVPYKKLSVAQKEHYNMFLRFLYELKRMSDRNIMLRYSLLTSLRGIFKLREGCYVVELDPSSTVLTEMTTSTGSGVYDNSPHQDTMVVKMSRRDFDEMMRSAFKDVPSAKLKGPNTHKSTGANYFNKSYIAYTDGQRLAFPSFKN